MEKDINWLKRQERKLAKKVPGCVPHIYSRTRKAELNLWNGLSG